MENNVTLYIAEHNQTGLKYFGRSSKWFTEDDLQKHYHGSGTDWKNHLEEFGDDVTMKIYGIYKLTEVKKIALKFSEENNIVKSKEWANLIPEDGRTVWTYGERAEIIGQRISKSKKGKPKSEEHKEKLRQANLGKKMSDETKEKIRLGNLGKIVSKETGKKISIAKKGWKPSEETRIIWSEQRKGKGQPHSEETKRKLSEDRKGKPLPQGTCPHCGKTTSLPLLNRWHLNNCKFKNEE